MAKSNENYSSVNNSTAAVTWAHETCTPAYRLSQQTLPASPSNLQKMPDYSEHIMKNWEWCEQYRSRLGREAYWKYVNKVIELLIDMKPDSFFSIEKNVKPENRDLFIKVCCVFIQEQFMSDQPMDFCHSFNSECTEIRCIKLYYSMKDNNDCNTETI